MTISHVVLLRWSEAAESGLREQIAQRVRALPALIGGIESVVEGPSVSTEGLEHGYDYGFIVTFVNVPARDEYLPHPAHLPLAGLIGDAASEVVVYDFTDR